MTSVTEEPLPLSRLATRAIKQQVRMYALTLLGLVGLANVGAWFALIPRLEALAAKRVQAEVKTSVDEYFMKHLLEMKLPIERGLSEISASVGAAKNELNYQQGKFRGEFDHQSSVLQDLAPKIAKLDDLEKSLGASLRAGLAESKQARDQARALLGAATGLEGEDEAIAALERLVKLVQSLKEDEDSMVALMDALSMGDDLSVRMEEAERKLMPHDTHSVWIDGDGKGTKLKETHSAPLSPDRHNKDAQFAEGIIRLTGAPAGATIYKAEYKCVSGRGDFSYTPRSRRSGTGHAAEYGASYDIIDGGRAIKWYRKYTSGPVQEEYTIYYKVRVEVCVGGCRAGAPHIGR